MEAEKRAPAIKNNTFINQNSNEELAPKSCSIKIFSQGKEAGNHSFNGCHFANATQKAARCSGVAIKGILY